MPELQEIEREAEEQQEEAQDIALEVEDHREKADRLAEAVAHLKEAQGALDSEGLRQALQDAQEAEQATRERLDELRGERDAMLAENERMREQCREASERKQAALGRVPLLLRAGPAGRPGADAAAPFYERMQAELGEDLRRTEQAGLELDRVRQELEALDL